MTKEVAYKVKKMKEGFLEYRKAGKSISEIAKIFEVSASCIYDNLQEIADFNNVTREDLLYRVYKKEHHPVKKANTVVISIAENGRIFPSNLLTYIPESWSDIFKYISRSSAVENLLLKQIKQLAKLIALTSNLNNNSISYELRFKDKKIKKAFYQLDKMMS